MKLGKWLSFLKTKRKQNGEGLYLARERIAVLDRLGMVWDGISDRWERNYHAAMDYYREHGNLKVPPTYVSADGLNLGRWIQSSRKSYRNGMLDRDQIDRLERIGMLWNASE